MKKKFVRIKKPAVIAKQKMIIKTLGKSRSVTQSAKDAGYSESYARSGQIQKTQTWQDLMDKYISDESLAKAHSEGLEADKHVLGVGKVEDHATRAKFVNMGYKLHKRYEEQHKITHEFSELTDEQLRAKRTEIAGRILEAGLGDREKKDK